MIGSSYPPSFSNFYLHQSLFLQHPFVTQPLSRTLAIELLDKANNPDHSTHSDAEEDDIDPEVMSYI